MASLLLPPRPATPLLASTLAGSSPSGFSEPGRQVQPSRMAAILSASLRTERIFYNLCSDPLLPNAWRHGGMDGKIRLEQY
ncbi:Os08g0265200 [Oryza sativa Japonica Group]|uniref:Os08g0265200 protein n=1 Tax=Oryza sativa subsp. japonica TaxID=39947 RepID=A0A0P0XDJ8_ORYSJ|nr:Os08g0265200 [Oryza sativa Japonica Group]